LEFLINLDIELFYFVNHGLHNLFFDIIMPIITTIKYWRIPILIGFLALFFFGKEKGRKTFIICLITLILSDGLTCHILKPLFHRLRPFEVLNNVNLLVLAYGYSFPSAHAANTFAQALVISHIWKRVWVSVLVFTIAILAGFSRVYVGVHYPIDILAGILVSILYAFLGIKIFNIIKKGGIKWILPKKK